MSLKIAVISDIHCKLSTEPRSNLTRLHSDMLREPWKRHPVEAILRLIKKERLTAHILLCPGDITDTISKQGFVSGWGFIEEIARELNVEEKIYATIGNHDVMSRENKPEQAFKVARELKNNFPLPHQNQQIEFWSDSFCIIEEEEFRLLIFNSAHDYYNTELSKRASIDLTTLSKIEERLKATDNSKFGIAMSHHHPINHFNTDYPDSDFIDKGDELLRILDSSGFSLFVHGHKHHPKLRYSSNIAVLGSASFSCLENLVETESSNMFHLIEIKGSKGNIKSWEYGPASGWKLQYGAPTFPSRTGFGFKGDLTDLARDISTWLTSQNVPQKKLKHLATYIEDINFLIPEHQTQLEEILYSQFSIAITPNISFGEEAIINKMETD